MDNPQYGTAYSPKNWRDTWGFNVSAEYKALTITTLRSGYVLKPARWKDSTCDYDPEQRASPHHRRCRLQLGSVDR